MWQPPTSPGPGTPAGPPPQQDPYAQQGSYAPPGSYPQPWAQGPGPWPPPPGTGWAPARAPRKPRSRKVVIAIVAACVLGVALLGAAIVGAVAVGRAAAQDTTNSASAPVTPSAPLAATGLGDNPDLNVYATRCHDGDMGACDDLYDQSDPMSRYEQYGMTCGGRVKPFDVEYCTDLG